MLSTVQNANSVGNASNNSNSSSSSSSSTSSSSSASASSLFLPTRKQSNPLNSTPQSKGSNRYQFSQPEMYPQLTPLSLPSEDSSSSSSTSVNTTNTTLSVSSTSSTSSSVSSSSPFLSSVIKTIEVYSNNLRKRQQSQLLQQSHLWRITPQNNNSLGLSPPFNASVKEDGNGMLEANTEIDITQAEDGKSNQTMKDSHISSKTYNSFSDSGQVKQLNLKENSYGSLANSQQRNQSQQQQQLSQSDGSPRLQTPHFFAQSQVPLSLPQNSADDTMANSLLSPPPFVSVAYPPSLSATLSASSSSSSLSSSSSSPPLSLSSSSIPSASFTSPSRHKSSNSTDQSTLFPSKLSSSQTSSASNTQLKSPRQPDKTLIPVSTAPTRITIQTVNESSITPTRKGGEDIQLQSANFAFSVISTNKTKGSTLLTLTTQSAQKLLEYLASSSSSSPSSSLASLNSPTSLASSSFSALLSFSQPIQQMSTSTPSCAALTRQPQTSSQSQSQSQSLSSSQNTDSLLTRTSSATSQQSLTQASSLSRPSHLAHPGSLQQSTAVAAPTPSSNLPAAVTSSVIISTTSSSSLSSALIAPLSFSAADTPTASPGHILSIFTDLVAEALLLFASSSVQILLSP